MKKDRPTSEPAARLDAETLAAFLDGALEESDRARVLEVLATSEADYEAFREAAALVRELEEERSDRWRAGEAGTGGSAGRAKGPARVRWSPRTVLLLAAGLAAVGLPVLVVNRHAATADRHPAAYARALAVSPAALPAGWQHPPWPAVRSADQSFSEQARAFRMGARLTAIEFARRAGLLQDAAAFADDAAEIASGYPAGSAVAAIFAAVAASPGDRNAGRLLQQGWRAMLAMPDSLWVRLGAWSEAARIAALSGDAGFFTSDRALRWMEEAASGMPPEIAGHLHEIRSAAAPLRTSGAAATGSQARSSPATRNLPPDLLDSVERLIQAAAR